MLIARHIGRIAPRLENGAELQEGGLALTVWREVCADASVLTDAIQQSFFRPDTRFYRRPNPEKSVRRIGHVLSATSCAATDASAGDPEPAGASACLQYLYSTARIGDGRR